MRQRLFEENCTGKYDCRNLKIYKCLNIVLFLTKMYYFSFSLCLNYKNPK